jgi:hypothetical protein
MGAEVRLQVPFQVLAGWLKLTVAARRAAVAGSITSQLARLGRHDDAQCAPLRAFRTRAEAPQLAAGGGPGSY